MNKTVVVTGASGGIGSAIAVAFAEKGYKVAVCYNTNESGAKQTLEKVIASGSSGIIIKADLTNEIEVEKLFDTAESELGGVDVLINNAGISSFELFTDLSLCDWNRVISTNLTSVFLCCKRVLKSMISRKDGVIINISSIWGETGAACEVAYSASKAGIIGLTKALAKEEGPSSIRVNCIAPGFIETEMNSRLTNEEISAFCEETPLCRTGTPQEVASAAVFLAENRFVTGQVIGVNGGIV